MSNPHNFAVAVVVSVMVSSVVLLAVLRPLKRALSLRCQGAEVLSFWRSFTVVMLYAVPLFFSALWTSFEGDLVMVVRTSLIASLFGAIGGLAIIGLNVASARPR